MENSNTIDIATRQHTPAANERLMLVRLTEHQWYPRKFDREISDKIARDYGAASADEAGRYNKLLVQVASIKPLKAAFTEMKTMHYQYTRPWSDRGERVLPVELYFEYVEKVRDAREKIQRLASEFAFNEYDKQRELARTRLNGMFKASDYPLASEVYERFGVDCKFSPLPNAEDCRVWGIGDEAAKQIQADVQASLQGAVDAAHQDIVDQVLQHGREFVAKVTKFHAGDSKKLYATAVENLRDITNLVLRGLNVTGDIELSALAKTLNDLIDDVNVDQLKHGEQLSLETTSQVEQTIKKFEGVYGA